MLDYLLELQSRSPLFLTNALNKQGKKDHQLSNKTQLHGGYQNGLTLMLGSIFCSLLREAMEILVDSCAAGSGTDATATARSSLGTAAATAAGAGTNALSET